MDAGTDMVILNGAKPLLIYDVLEGKQVGTRFIGRKQS
jgi:glutamate 5-kinase